MKFFSLRKSSNVRSSSSWAWPSCHQPKTPSFRVTPDAVNSVAETTESFFTESPNSASFSTASEISRGVDPTETVIRGLRSDRLFFEPDETSSIMEAKLAVTTIVPFKNSVVLSINSNDPYVDFRNSMEEIVHTLGLNDWESLEELLCWYLKFNEKNNHEYIVVAFVDLLFDLTLSNSPPSSPQEHSRPSSPLFFNTSSSSLSSSCSTRCVYCLERDVEKKEEECGVSAASSFSSEQCDLPSIVFRLFLSPTQSVCRCVPLYKYVGTHGFIKSDTVRQITAIGFELGKSLSNDAYKSSAEFWRGPC
ncbi:hypothetical protein VNO78_21100 [Psophocarpus tetragonolobus]|uniref:Transcription repressor n=1 Tax=Psophocarpus tetragonolobus TaxID=3891 RepID=A0AAN9SBM5_PSOTE